MTSARVVLLGPPGAGKGTQAKLLRQRFDACQISTGDILRKAVVDKTPLGEQAADYINRGGLVPDSVIVELVGERLKEDDCAKGFVLDGFPRTISQAESLEGILQRMRLQIDGVVSMKVPRNVIIDRLAGRRTCMSCGALYHISFDPSKSGDECERCGGELNQRDDDREETIATRLNVYEEQTAPLVNYYGQRGKLHEVDGVGKVDEIHARILRALQEPSN